MTSNDEVRTANSKGQTMSIDCAFFGFLAADAEQRTSQAGKPWARMRVGVGKDADMQWVSVAVFGKAAETAGELKKGDRIYCEGTIKLDTWRGQDGVERHGLSVACFKLEQTHQIGRSRPSKKPSVSVAGGTSTTSRDQHAESELNDEIPF
jgi:single-stranded DNA-binding protein